MPRPISLAPLARIADQPINRIDESAMAMVPNGPSAGVNRKGRVNHRALAVFRSARSDGKR
jgi:hypothetical protein